MFHYQKTREKFRKYLKENKNKISWTVFFTGFVVDIITLTKIDFINGIFVLGIYLSIALFLIILMNYGDYRGIKSKLIWKIYNYAPLFLQFVFGALLSGFVVYYTLSASFFVSWPFLILIYIFFFLNEKIEKYYEKFEFQISIFFLSFFSFMIFFFPALVQKTGRDIFIASGALTILLIYWILKFIFKIIPILKKKKWKILRNLSIVFIIFNISYFSNIIPPVPLSVKESEIAHWVGRNKEGKYSITDEVKKFDFKSLKSEILNIYHKRPGERVYFFVAVYAPNKLKTKIIHKWYYYNEMKKEWEFIQEVSYKIIGGSKTGYRGYSFLTDPAEGKWKIDVTTEDGLIIHREKFRVKSINENLELKTEVLDYKNKYE